MGLKKRIDALASAVDDRTGIGSAVDYVANHPVHGGARYAYALGSALVFTFIVQIVTGIALASTYSPSVTDAWGSVYLIEHHMLMGSFVRGVHHWGSSAMIVLCVLHMTQVLLFGAHKKPRELNWILGIIMLLVVLGFGLTGYLLPWDQKGYWATQVATGIIGSGPLGGELQTMVQGGSDYGNATLTRFFTLHVFILPGALITLLVGHLALFYRHGVKTSPRAKPRNDVPFWPFQMFRDLVVAAIVFGVLIALALLVGVSLDAPADPASGYEARPEWYFLFLFQLLKYFEGPLAFIGTIVLPTLAVLFLLAIPFIDRKPGPAPSRSVVIPFFLMLAGAAILTLLAMRTDANSEAFQRAKAQAEAQAHEAIAMAEIGGVDASGRVTLFEAQKLYRDAGCASCHEATDVAAPALVGYGSRDRLKRFLLAPNDKEFFGGTPLDGAMDPVEVEGKDLDTLVDYLHSLSGAPGSETDAATVARGFELLTEADCVDCHNLPGASKLDKDSYDPTATGPDLDGLYGFEWTRALLRDASHPMFYGGSLSAKDLPRAMPSYLHLSDDELTLLTRWLQAGAPLMERSDEARADDAEK